jgi:hypothetical protein
MDHAMPASKKGKEDMAGMDHAGMNHDKKKPAPGHAAMDPGAAQPPGKVPAADHTGMDHGAMPAAGNHQQPGHSPGQGVKTDQYGRPLIDPSQPYDNNPAREQAPHRLKEQ